jgi:hypothetical protein
MHVFHKDARYICNGNTWGKEGPVKGHESAMKLDGATRNRFVKIWIDYDESLETELALAQYDHADTHKWLALVRKYRQANKDLGMNEYFTPRNSIDGARMLRIGFSLAEVTEMSLTADLSPESARKLAESVR